jgi:ATP-dependent RNA helicase DDX54/DBP10
MWKEKSKVNATNDDSEEEEAPKQKRELICLLESYLIQSRCDTLCIYFICILVRTIANTHWARHNQKLMDKAKVKNELKRPEQVLKARKLLQKKQRRNGKKGKGQKNKRRHKN